MSGEIRILHTADIHLDSPLKSLALVSKELQEQVQAATRSTFQRIVDLAIDEKVSALLISGDLFDRAEKSARTLAFLINQFERLQQKQIRVFYIKGNHDAANPLVSLPDWPDNVHVFDGHGGKQQLGNADIWIHGVSFSRPYAEQSLLPKFGAPVEDAINIGMLHTSLAGAVGHDPYAPCTVNDLVAKGFDYWALGHVHKRQVHSEKPWIVMPGIPQGRDIGEAGVKSVSLLRISGGKIEVDEIPVCQVRFERCEINISAATSNDQVRQLVKSELAELERQSGTDNLVLRLELTGQPANYWEVLRDREFLEAYLRELSEEIDGLYIEKCKFAFQPPTLSEQQDDAAVTAVDELYELMGELASEPYQIELTSEEVDSVLSKLSADQKQALMPDEESANHLKSELAASAIAQITARMKGNVAQ